MFSELKSKRTIEKEDKLSPIIVLGKPSELVIFQAPINVRAKVQMTYSGILAEASVRTTGKLECSRCLEKFERTFEGEFTETFSSDLDKVNLDSNIRETIILDIPIRALCRESCLGICDKCGVNKNQNICQCASENAKPLEKQFKNFPFK